MQKHRAAEAYQDSYKGIRLLETPCYHEFEIPLDSGGFGVIYGMRRDDNSFAIHACMPDAVSLVINAYVTLDSRSRKAVLGIYREAWPLLMDLHEKEASGHPLPAALTIVQDPDDFVNRWSVATAVGNVGRLSAEGALTSERVLRAMVGVINSSEAVVRQVTTSTVDGDRLATILRRSEVAGKLRSATRFLSDNFAPMIELIKVLDSNE